MLKYSKYNECENVCQFRQDLGEIVNEARQKTISLGKVGTPCGKFQNLDPKFVTFFDVLRHFSAHQGDSKYQIHNLHKIAIILVADLVLYIQY